MTTLHPIAFGQESRHVTASGGRTPSGTVSNSLFSGTDAITLSPQALQQRPLFAGNAHKIAESYKAEKATEAPLSKEDADFKAICDVVVWTKPGVDNPGPEDTLTVGDMIAYLCRIRPNDNYPGYGNVEEISKNIPGLVTKKLKKGFSALFEHDSTYLGHDNSSKSYWLRPSGKEKLEELYPDINLFSKKKRFISNASGK